MPTTRHPSSATKSILFQQIPFGNEQAKDPN